MAPPDYLKEVPNNYPSPGYRAAFMEGLGRVKDLKANEKSMDELEALIKVFEAVIISLKGNQKRIRKSRVPPKLTLVK